MNHHMGGRPPLSPTKHALLAKQLRTTSRAWEVLRSEPIAIVGMGCRFPGGADTPEAYWRLLCDNVDAVREIPSHIWDLETFYDPDRDAPGTISTRWCGWLDGIDRFDAAFFGVSPREATRMDPQQRLMLEVAWEALERAGQSAESLAGSTTGVFVGVSGSDYGLMQTADTALIDTYTGTGTAANIVAGRIAYLLDLHGPCVSVDTACSSSLVAVHLACQSLRAGECELAVAGGVSIVLAPESVIPISRMHMLAADGRCKTFDARADGFVWGDGCGAVVLKRLSDALRDDDPIEALVLGSAINQDGRSAGLTAPNGRAQQAVIRQALQIAGLPASALGYVETHGAGTQLGDPIEVEALAAVMGRNGTGSHPCILGAVKTNLGHLEAAAGIAGLIKAVLALRHGAVPANLHFESLNPQIRLDSTRFVLPQDLTPWPDGAGGRYAGVSSFGWSGTNAHAVLSVLAAEPEAVRPPADAGGGPHLLALSARDPQALAAMATAYCAALEPATSPLRDICYTAGARRSHHPHRLAVVANTAAEAAAALRGFLDGSDEAASSLRSGRAPSDHPLRPVFVFPGQGGQWLGMGRELLSTEPTFREAVGECAAAIRRTAGWDLLDLLQGEEALNEIDRLQPALFAISVGLAALWRSWGVEPAMVVGHSLGEVGAAFVAGALTLDDAALIISERSRLLRRHSGRGAMAAVELTLDQAIEVLRGYEDRLSVGVSNGRRSTVLSGDPRAMDEVLATLERRGVYCRLLNVDVSSHSPFVEPLRDELLAALSGVRPRVLTLPLLSTVSAELVDGDDLDAAYWMRNLRETVRFAAAIERLILDGYTTFIELGPHPVLLAPIAGELAECGAAGLTLPSLRRGEGERGTMLSSLGALYAAGQHISWPELFHEGGTSVPLPTYPWQRERYWLNPTDVASGNGSGRRRAGQHPLLGESVDTAAPAQTRLWQASLATGHPEYLADHRVRGLVVLPASAYLELALVAGQRAFGEGTAALESVRFEQLLPVNPGESRTLQLILAGEGPDLARFRVFSRPEGSGTSWVEHASGGIMPGGAGNIPPVPLDAVLARCPEAVTGEEHYGTLASQGVDYGPSFRGVAELWRGAGEVIARLEPPPEVAADPAPYLIHPALLDAALQVLSDLVPDRTGTYLPVGADRVEVSGRADGELWAHAVLRPDGRSGAGGGEVVGDVSVLDGHGRCLVRVQGLTLHRLADGGGERRRWLYELEWVPQDRPGERTAAGASYLITGGDEAGAHALASELTAMGASCCVAGSDGAADPLARSREAGWRAVIHLTGSAAGHEPAGAAEPTTHDLAAAVELVHAIAAAQQRDAPRVWLVTRGSQPAGGAVAAPEGSLLWGFGRTVAYEHPELRCSLLDLAAGASPGEPAELAAEIAGDGAEDQVALRPVGRFVARLRQAEARPERVTQDRVRAAGRPFRLEIDTPGVLDRMAWWVASRRAPGAGEVEVRVAAAGLNFLDVLKALGSYPGQTPGRELLGRELAGVVTSVGRGVSGLRPGDAVMGCADACFGSHVTLAAQRVVRVPDGIPLELAAGVPIVYATARYSLHHLARLGPGERVLIHSAASGTGLAALHVARRLGAEIVATAGTEQKRSYLRSLGVHDVFHSRSSDFAQGVMEATGGRGVDVVLNSLPGPLAARGLDVLAPHGRFVELSKRDILGGRSLDLLPFQRGLSYFAVDLAAVAACRPDVFHALLEDVREELQSGALAALPTEVVPAAAVQEAFHTMAQGRHIGKLVVSLSDAEDVTVAAGARVRPDVTYLITGGLGGLGLRLAESLVAQGARSLVLAGRSAPRPDAAAAVAKLAAAGATVRVRQVDVADRAQVLDLIGEIDAGGPPLGGVFHAAAVIEDALLVNTTPDQIARVVAPKVAGAWHLHTLTEARPLDCFVLFSSAASVLGSPGQCSYAAANAYLDALAHHRRARALPALAVNWGAWAEVGLAAAEDKRGRRLADRGMGSMPPAEALAMLNRLMEAGATQVAVMPFDARRWRQYYPTVAAAAVLSDLDDGGGAAAGVEGDRGLGQLHQLAPGTRRVQLEQFVREHVSRVLRQDQARLAADVPFQALGLDSLMAIELRNRLEVGSGVMLPTTVIWAYPTIAALARHLEDQLGFGGEEAAGAAAWPGQEHRDVDPFAAELEAMSDDEAEDLLAARLEELEAQS
jgi:acyl transferase domain-containing protein/NADPH:quinone reductase-like Zn-dependent oxidoreductase/NAD(P)-dependent dehydrogenase (short-subunit alcohol dehydrogenase family)/acyl carrier protein